MNTILVIDDDFAMRRGIALLLRGEGYNVLEAENSVQALMVLANGSLDLVIVDLFLAGKSGLELAEEIRKLSPSIKLLIVTAYGEHIRAAKAREIFKENYLDKTGLEDILVKKVREILSEIN